MGGRRDGGFRVVIGDVNIGVAGRDSIVGIVGEFTFSEVNMIIDN